MNKLVFMAAILVLHCLTAVSAVSEPTRFTIKEYVIEGNTLLLDRVIRQWLTPYFGADRDLDDVKKAVQALRRLYHDSGHPDVDVVIPEQNYKVGKVVLKVIENPAADVKAKSEPEADTASLAVPPPPPPLPLPETDQNLNVEQAKPNDTAVVKKDPAKRLKVSPPQAELSKSELASENIRPSPPLQPLQPLQSLQLSSQTVQSSNANQIDISVPVVEDKSEIPPPVEPETPGFDKFDITEFVIDGNTLLLGQVIQQWLSPFTGVGRDMSHINKAVLALRSLYNDSGHPLVQVVAPTQTVVAGKVVLKVIEDKITAIEVRGNSAFGADNIRASLPSLRTGKSLNARQLEAAIALANENSAKQVAVNVQTGNQPGDISTTINVTEDKISKWVATYDNTGNEATGFNKIGLTYQNANLFNRDHALTLQYNSSLSHIDDVYSLSVGYHVPFYSYGVSADLIAAYSSSSGQNVNLYFSGKGTVLGARLNYPLPSMGDIRQKLIVGADIKNSESVAGPLVTPISEMPFSLTYQAQVTRPVFQGSASAALVTNFGGGSHGSADDYYNPVTGFGARAPVSGPESNRFPSSHWRALRLNASGGFALPKDWQARVGINTQYSYDLLLPSEQLGAGGAGSVRGYPERVISGDKGYTANLELYTPELNKYIPLPDSSLRALLFWDAGGVSINDQPLPVGINGSSSISGLGMGLRLTYKKNTTFKADMGWAQKTVGQAPLVTKRGNKQGNVSMSVAF